jgi:hypothetical protein
MLAVYQFCYTFAFGGSFIHLVQYLIGIGYTQAAGTMVVSFSLGLALIGKPVMGMLGRDDGPSASRAIRRRHRLLHCVIRGLRAGRTGGRHRFIPLCGACAGTVGPGEIESPPLTCRQIPCDNEINCVLVCDPHERHFRPSLRRIADVGDSVANRVEFELSGDFISGQ